MQNNNRHFKIHNIYMFLLCFAALFMSVGYAAINSISLNLNGEMFALAQEGVFITEVNIDSENSVDADFVNTKVNSSYQTTLNSSVYLSDTNPDSTVVMDVTIHNSTDDDYVFNGVTYEVGNNTYSNENIVYSLSGLENGNKLSKNNSITFEITFSYKDNKLTDNNILLSYLNFNFDVYVPDVLYEMMAYNSRGTDQSLNFGSSPNTSTSGVYTMESTASDTYPVHYYRGILDNNNVLFANFCWKMVRTTDTGGVKLIYNGEPNEDGQCLSDRSNHIGYGNKTTQTLSNNYYYGTSYTYDTSTSKFSLAGELTQTTWNETTGPTLIGKFTCKSATADGTCSTLYQVASYNSASSAYVFPLNTTTNYTQIGVSKFNTSYSSPADVGYMYDTRYTDSSKGTSSSNVLTRSSTSASSNYYYGNDIIINANGTYTLQNKTLNDDGETYTITEAEQKTWSDNYSTLAGYYTCRTTSTTCSTVYYIAGTASSYQYNVTLTSGATLDSQKIVVSATKTNNADGTYTLSEPLEVLKKDWFANYSKYKNYYVCNDLTSTTCSPMAQITSTSNYQVTRLETIGFVYGNDVSWDGTNYTLVDTIKSNGGWSTDRTNLATKYHYTCLDTDGVCTSVYYIHYFGNSSTIYYLTLKDGKNIEVAKDEMFTNDKNSTSSDIKQQVDSWYAANMTEYTDKLEDTIWCNDRTFYSGTLKSKDTSSTSNSYFGGYGRNETSPYKPSVTCPEPTRDGFTVNQKTGGNGLLKYPVGLLTADELTLAGHGWSGYSGSGYLRTGQYYWSLSPRSFGNTGATGFRVGSSGNLINIRVDLSLGVRPSVSLAPGTKHSGGDGTETSPYIVE